MIRDDEPAVFSMKFACDNNLGKLAKWLRVLGYDTVCVEMPSRDHFLRWRAEGRVYLRRSRAETEKGACAALFVEENDPVRQLAYVVEAFHLKPDRQEIFTRCIRCNELLNPVSKKEVESKVPPRVYQTHSDFLRCPVCGRIYWPGGHSKRMLERIVKMGVELK